MDKRNFLKNLSMVVAGSSVFFNMIEALARSVAHISPISLAEDEDFWLKIRNGYRLKPDYINPESGYYCIIPQEIL